MSKQQKKKKENTIDIFFPGSEKISNEIEAQGMPSKIIETSKNWTQAFEDLKIQLTQELQELKNNQERLKRIGKKGHT